MEGRKDIKQYFNARIGEIGGKDIHPIRDGRPDDTETIFREGENGIDIHYYNQRGHAYRFNTSTARWGKRYVRTRLADPKGDAKYLSKKGAGVNPFFTPYLQKQYQTGAKVELLVLTEGEFKAFVACKEKYSIPTIGLNGITGYIEESGSDSLHPDILDFIIVCKVKKILLLTDADTLVLNWKADKDLTKRQHSFASAVDKFIKIGKELIVNPKTSVSNVYFGHIKAKFNDTAKGLDDLILHQDSDKQEIKADLEELSHSNKYFDIKDVSKVKNGFSRAYFGLMNVEDFYRTYKKYIKDKVFIAWKSIYEFDGEKVAFIRAEGTDRYLRVETDYYKLVDVHTHRGVQEQRLIPWKSGEIVRDYRKISDKIFEKMPKYDFFVNEPCWETEEYKRVHGQGYNLCNPLAHKPQFGEISNTLNYLMHAFGNGNNIRHYLVKNEEGNEVSHSIECVELGNQFTVAMDWLTILLKYPKQKVPVPILVSPEQVTGKTTFLTWLCKMFQGNGVVINNEQMKSQFNASFITKFIIGLDEGFLDMDKKSEKEKLKQLVTSPEQQINEKGVRMKTFPYFGKLVICSNDADSVMKMDDEDTRWFVVRVPIVKKKDPDLEQKMENEIPAFLDYLFEREIFHPREDRLWFKTEHFITEQFKTIVENTRPQYQQEIEEYIKFLFLEVFKTPTVQAGYEDIIKGVNLLAKYRIDKNRVKEYLVKIKGLQQRETSTTYEHPTDEPDGKGGKTLVKKRGRCWMLSAEDWLNEKELDIVYPKRKLSEEEKQPQLQL